MMKRIPFFIAIMAMLSFATLGAAEPGKVDRAGFRANSKITVTNSHHENHEGHLYRTGHNATLASGAKFQLLINTPTAEKGLVHLLHEVRSSGESNYALSEYSTVSALGSAKEEINMNRTSANVAGAEITLAPTITGIGNILSERHIGSGQNTGGETRANHEFVLKPETLYIVNGTSEAASNDMELTMIWYEHIGDAP